MWCGWSAILEADGSTSKVDARGYRGHMVDTQAANGRQTATSDPSVGLPHAPLMTKRYVVTSSAFDFDAFNERQHSDVGPGHAMGALADCLDAEIVQPADESARRRDRLGARLVGQPQHWALARQLLAELRSGDLVYATGDDCGLPIGLLAAARRRKIKLAIFYSAPNRVRARVLTKMLARLGVDVLPIAGAANKVESLTALGIGRPGLLASEQTDTTFFRPSRAERDRSRPLITSCGLEQRDYATLTDAIEGMAVDVKVCAVSPNFTSETTVAMPEVMPSNLEMRRFEFAELRGLYQDAAVTVIPLLDNHYSAGMTTMMEAIACSSPVVITANPGLAADFVARDLVVGVPAGDKRALRRAIQGVLDDPETASDRAERARSFVLANHSSARYVELLCGSLMVFHAS